MAVEKKIILILGKRGTGKSYLASKLIENERRLFVFDTLGEYEKGVVFTIDLVKSENKALEKYLEFWRHVYSHNFRIIYRPLKPAEEIDKVAELIFALGNVTFVVEEIDCYCTSFQISDSFAHIIQRGRHKNITLIGVTQRPFGIHRLLTSQAKEIYVFGTNEPRDRDYLKQLLGQEIEAKLDVLKQYEYVHWQEGKTELKIGKA